MNLYLLRHAHALDVGEAGVETDEERPLSDEGVRGVADLAAALRRYGVTFDAVYSSPLRRAAQTAEELTRHLSGPAVTTAEQLAPGWSPKKLGRHLLAAEGEELLLVGHEPEIGRLAAWLIGSKEVQIAFAKGALACVRCDGSPRKGAGTLVWLITPKWLTALTSEP